MRKIIAAIGILATGVTAGAVFARSRLAPQLENVSQQRDNLADELGEAKTAFRKVDEYASQLKLENSNLSTQLNAIYEELEVETPAAPNPVATSVDEEQVETNTPPAENNRRGRRGRREFTEEERARWEERRAARQDAFQQRRDRIQNYWDDEYARAADPVVQDRILSLLEYESYMGELRTEMRSVQTDEERVALFDEMREAGAVRTNLLREQQDYLLREIAKLSGIADAQAQEDLVNAFHELLQSPTFQTQGGRAGGRRGPGGGFGRGPVRPSTQP